jgi:hypothetical protein
MVGCPQLIFYGVRGSGEAFDDSTLGLGAPLYSVYSDLVPAFQGGTGVVGAVANGYPAVSVPWKLARYTSSVSDGVASILADLPALHASCPNSYFVVAGYSQGADVVRRALPNLDPSRNRIMTVKLFGDPNWRPGEAGVRQSGDFGFTNTGIATLAGKLRRAPAVPASFVNRLDSWCKAADPVCQGTDWFDASAHLRYSPNETQAAAWRIAQGFAIVDRAEATPSAFIGAVSCNGSTPVVDVIIDMSDQEAVFTASIDLYIGVSHVVHYDVHGGQYLVDSGYALPPGVSLVWVVAGTTVIEQRYVQAPAC